MKILFSNPPWWESKPYPEPFRAIRNRQGIRAGSRWPFTRDAVYEPDKFQYGHYLPLPFFMTSAAAYAEQQLDDAKVIMRDSIARGESYESFFMYLGLEKPEWIVLETATPSFTHDCGLICQIKDKFPETEIILTGTIVADRDFIVPTGVRGVVRGEYEKGVVAIVKAGGTKAPGSFEDFNLLTKSELNALPFPLMDPDCEGRYCDSNPRMPGEAGQQFPHLQIWTSRGCPYKCCFCGWPATMTGNDPDGTQARSVRNHSPDWVEKMILTRLDEGKRRGIVYRSIYIDDDTFNLTNQHVQSIAPVMKRIGLPWSAMCRADTLTNESWKLMREAGCFGVKVGVESGSQRVINEIVNKRLSLHNVETIYLPLLKELGFIVHTTWTEGLPGETEHERAQTHMMIQRLYEGGLHKTHQLSGTAEISGTPLHTLRMKGDLAKYPGAHIGPGYQVSFDGQAKVEVMERDGPREDSEGLPPAGGR